jgi:hypothetical protein
MSNGKTQLNFYILLMQCLFFMAMYIYVYITGVLQSLKDARISLEIVLASVSKMSDSSLTDAEREAAVIEFNQARNVAIKEYDEIHRDMKIALYSNCIF